jgi:phospholipase/carboxylesterase
MNAPTLLIAVVGVYALTLGSGCRSGARPPAATSSSPDRGDARWGGLQVQMVGEAKEGETGGQVVVLLHGWGASGDDLVPLARQLVRAGTRFVVPVAPLEHPAGGGARAWWHLDLERRRRAVESGARDLREEVPEGMVAARTQVQGLLRDVRAHHKPAVLNLVGFSQGGMLATDVALAADPPVDGVAILSGTLLAEAVWRKAAARPGPKPMVFLSHGREDALLPFPLAEQLKTLLEQNQYPVTWVPFDGGHAIPPEVTRPLTTFLYP